MKIEIMAREKEDQTGAYQYAQQFGLSTTYRKMGGTGACDDPVHFKFRIRNRGKKNWAGILHVKLFFSQKDPRFFMPAFMYGRNRGESPLYVDNRFPRIRAGNPEFPASPWWMVRGDHLSHPGVLVYDSGMVFGFHGSSYFLRNKSRKVQWRKTEKGEFYQYAGYSCSMEEGCIGYTLGYENAPWLFVRSHDIEERTVMRENCFELAPEEEVEFDLYVYEYAAENETGINGAVRNIYSAYHQNPRKGSTVKTAAGDISNAIWQYAWLKAEKGYAGFVWENRETGELETMHLGSLSWTNGLSVAVPMLMTAHRLHREDMRSQALECIENIVKNCMNEKSGLPFDGYNNGKWGLNGWWFDKIHVPGHSAYLVGQAVYYILKAYETELRNGHEHRDWIVFAEPVLKKMERERNTDGEYPYIFSGKTGAGLEYDSLGSSWCLAATAYYTWLTGNRQYLEGMLCSEQCYYDSFIKHMECYGGPLDTDKAVDSEGVLAYIRAVRYLHMLTGREYLLYHLRDGLEYEFTFKFCYNVPVQVPPLGRIGWSSCGGSVTSTANPHIHPMSSTIVDEIQYYVNQTGDAYFRTRMQDTVAWGCQTYNTYDKEYDYGFKGWMSERFCYSEGLLVERYPDQSPASTWFRLMPWGGASILEGLTGECWEENGE